MFLTPTGERFDLLTSSPNLFFTKMNGDQNLYVGIIIKGYLLQHYVIIIIALLC